jgi:hypothetical protein
MVQLNIVLADSDDPVMRIARPRSHGGRAVQAVKGPSMEKWLCWGSMGVAGLLLLMFLLDLAIGIPFQKVNVVVDVFGILASGLVLYLGWDAFKDLR